MAVELRHQSVILHHVRQRMGPEVNAVTLKKTALNRHGSQLENAFHVRPTRICAARELTGL